MGKQAWRQNRNRELSQKTTLPVTSDPEDIKKGLESGTIELVTDENGNKHLRTNWEKVVEIALENAAQTMSPEAYAAYKNKLENDLKVIKRDQKKAQKKA